MNTRGLSIIFFLGLSLALAVCWLPVGQPEMALAAPNACVAGPHSGTIKADQEWCAINSPHYVTGSISINAGVTLTIEAGVVVYFYPGTTMDVKGALTAVGTSNASITITSSSGTPHPGDWGAISMKSGSHVSLAYCDISNGGSPAWGSIGLSIETTDVQVRHCRIHHTNNNVVYIQGVGLAPVFEDVEIDHNPGNYPLHQSTITQHPSYTNVRLHDNGVDALLISPSQVDQDVTLDGSPTALNGAPIYYEGGNVQAGKTLTVTPGTTIKFGGNRTLNVIGGLIAEGTPALPITFTSQSATPQPGDWGVIGMTNSSHGRLAYCDIAYAGGPGGASLGLNIAASDVQVRHCRIHHTNGVAVQIEGVGLAPVFEDIEIDHNPGDVSLRQSTITQHPSYTNVRLHDNGVDALWILPSQVDQDVTLDGSPMALNGAPIYYEGGNVQAGKTLTVTPGTTIKFGGNRTLNVIGGLIAEGTPALPITFTSRSAAPQPGDWGAINMASGSHVRLAYCDIAYAGGPGGASLGLNIATSDVQIRSCRIHHTKGYAVTIQNNIQVAAQNLVIMDNGGTAISILPGARLDGRHLTLARNGTGINVAKSGTLAMTNTILSQNTIGVSVAGGGTANLAQTLWDSNGTDGIGIVNETGRFDGTAGFGPDGYHLTYFSVALEQGIDAGVTDDIDGEARPQPALTRPDLGADEFNVKRIWHIYIPALSKK